MNICERKVRTLQHRSSLPEFLSVGVASWRRTQHTCGRSAHRRFPASAPGSALFSLLDPELVTAKSFSLTAACFASL